MTVSEAGLLLSVEDLLSPESPAADGVLLLPDWPDEDAADAADFLSAAASVFLLLA
ncbi:MAG: hypothetical protein NTV05_12250 [Acidobacteria bacterium]|nr:hypothetical protein [Acidobacteriota bacterium]